MPSYEIAIEAALESVRKGQAAMKGTESTRKSWFDAYDTPKSNPNSSGLAALDTLANHTNFTDKWEDSTSWMRQNIVSGGKNGFISMGGKLIPLTIPPYQSINGKVDGKPVYATMVNGVMEYDGWKTVGTIRNTAQLEDNTALRNTMVGIAASTGLAPVYLAADPNFYKGLVLTNTGDLARLGKGGTGVEMPELYAPPEDDPYKGKVPEVKGVLDRDGLSKAEKLEGNLGAFALGVQVADGIMKDQYKNFYFTQTLIQENANGEKRAIIVISQISQAWNESEPTLKQSYLTTGADGKLVGTPVTYPPEMDKTGNSVSKYPTVQVKQYSPSDAERAHLDQNSGNCAVPDLKKGQLYSGTDKKGKTQSDVGYKNPTI